MQFIKSILAATLLLAGCASTPNGPTVNVMPGVDRKGHVKPLELFAQDAAVCRNYAAADVEGGASRANWTQAAVAGGGTLLGAGLGAALGGGRGAAIGAGGGALAGATVSGLKSGADQNTLQKRYDMAYMQCMSTKGNRVAG